MLFVVSPAQDNRLVRYAVFHHPSPNRLAQVMMRPYGIGNLTRVDRGDPQPIIIWNKRRLNHDPIPIVSIMIIRRMPEISETVGGLIVEPACHMTVWSQDSQSGFDFERGTRTKHGDRLQASQRAGSMEPSTGHAPPGGIRHGPLLDINFIPRKIVEEIKGIVAAGQRCCIGIAVMQIDNRFPLGGNDRNPDPNPCLNAVQRVRVNPVTQPYATRFIENADVATIWTHGIVRYLHRRVQLDAYRMVLQSRWRVVFDDERAYHPVAGRHQNDVIPDYDCVHLHGLLRRADAKPGYPGKLCVRKLQLCRRRRRSNRNLPLRFGGFDPSIGLAGA